MEAAIRLKQAGARFAELPWYNYPGFTLYPVNASVGVHNRTRLSQIDTPGYSLLASRWGEQTEDLKEVPDVVALKDTCRIRITANDSFATGNPAFVNGQLGTLESYDPLFGPTAVLDKANGEPQDDAVTLPKVVRFALRLSSSSVEDQSLINRTAAMKAQEFRDYLINHLIPKKIVPFYHPQRERIAIGAVEYYPIVLGYASTVHKAQGLTFDRVQIDFRGRMAGDNQMMYVALSRCRSVEGLLLAGAYEKLSRRINTSPQVARFI